MNVNSLDDFNKIYFIGIGGVSMSGLATILIDNNKCIMGSDINKSPSTVKLENLGAKINYVQVADNIKDVDLIVHTAAISPNNPELVKGRQLSIPIIDRAKLLGLMMKNYNSPICVSGTHGKSTTTSMISELFLGASLDPTITVGGNLSSIGGNLKMGGNEYFIVESCEYYNSFLQFHPHSAVILNIEFDHVDYFSDLRQIEESFIEFGNNIDEKGCLIINSEVRNLSEFYERVKCNITTFGIEKGDICGSNIRYDSGSLVFDLKYFNEDLGEIRMNVFGKHNVENALASIGIALYYGIGIETIRKCMNDFKGICRRFEYKGSYKDAKIIDDYAHHPTEIKCTLSAVKNLSHNNIWTVFQPHTFSRTKDLLDEFASSFDDSDKIILLDIFSAREEFTDEIHSIHLNDLLKQRGKESYYFPSFDDAEEFIVKKIERDDVLITMGAGNIYRLGEDLLNK